MRGDDRRCVHTLRHVTIRITCAIFEYLTRILRKAKSRASVHALTATLIYGLRAGRWETKVSSVRNDFEKDRPLVDRSCFRRDATARRERRRRDSRRFTFYTSSRATRDSKVFILSWLAPNGYKSLVLSRVTGCSQSYRCVVNQLGDSRCVAVEKEGEKLSDMSSSRGLLTDIFELAEARNPRAIIFRRAHASGSFAVG